MDPSDRRLLKLIAISTTFVAAVLALAIVLALVGVILVHAGGNSGQVITGRMTTRP
jgi:hypothetical protein